ncbi:MAG: hypothetical protein GX576_15135 [Thauera phenolivorans]|uniref:Lipoprotein n=1 Tax=Thauera phenolivorans TaxID=1792543 RepID=A0A7X7LZD8_9RHOO|nr:hypothetical protein [Thauera phenolivorans]NLF55701.1 hypothetical protein [Thauera phenolivorans]
MNLFRLAAIPCAAAALLGACARLPAVGFDAGAMFEDVRSTFDTRPVPASLAPALRPAYRRGDTFVFGRKTVRRVAAVGRDGIEWTTEDGERYRATRDFFVPHLAYEHAGQRVSSTISGRPEGLWPLEVGKKLSFEETRRTFWPATGNTRSVDFRWDCEVVDARMAYVAAGDFETFHVRCSAYRAGFFLPVQTLSWDYSPALGHYVRRTWFDGGSSRELVLSAALPGELASETRIARVLERLATE